MTRTVICHGVESWARAPTVPFFRSDILGPFSTFPKCPNWGDMTNSSTRCDQVVNLAPEIPRKDEEIDKDLFEWSDEEHGRWEGSRSESGSLHFSANLKYVFGMDISEWANHEHTHDANKARFAPVILSSACLDTTCKQIVQAGAFIFLRPIRNSDECTRHKYRALDWMLRPTRV